MFTRGLNQDGDVVLSWKRTVMIPRRGQGIGENYFPTAKAAPLQPMDPVPAQPLDLRDR